MEMKKAIILLIVTALLVGSYVYIVALALIAFTVSSFFTPLLHLFIL